MDAAHLAQSGSYSLPFGYALNGRRTGEISFPTMSTYASAALAFEANLR